MKQAFSPRLFVKGFSIGYLKIENFFLHSESCGSQIVKNLKFNVHSAVQKQTYYIKQSTMTFIHLFIYQICIDGGNLMESTMKCIHSFIYSPIHPICIWLGASC